MKDISEIHPDKNFHYFGFINESNYNLLEGNNILDENLFIQKIEEEIKSFKNFKIYIFIIKNNKLFQYSLDEQLLYGIHYYNMTEKKINEYRQETKDLEKKIENVENKLQKQIENLEIKLNNIENMISNLALKNKREENQNSNNSRFNNNFRFHRGRTFGYNRGRTYYHNGRARRFRFYRK
jgi:TFIIF-interacting CTD phosphatase-like protein